MKLIDITRPVLQAPIYPGSSPVKIERVSDMKTGGAYNASLITAGSHMGTHADAYTHFLKDSEVGIDAMELWRYYGRCRLVQLKQNALISAEELAGALGDCERLALKTGGDRYLSESAARAIVSAGIALVVTDALSVAPPEAERPVHEILLSAGVAIVENATFERAEPGDYTICAFPIKIDGCDGAPVRAVLLQP